MPIATPTKTRFTPATHLVTAATHPVAAAMTALFLFATAAFAQDNAAAPATSPFAFKPQEIDKSLTVGYAVRVADVDADGKPDVLVCDAARVVWFRNPDWKLHTVIDNKAAGVKADNVCIDTYDVDADGRLDVALGADWQPNNTRTGGSLQWLQQPKDLSQPWAVHKIKESDPTLHRIHFGDLDGDGRKELLVGPLKGVGATAKEQWADAAVKLTAYKLPADPTKGPWEQALVTDQLHVMHNFLPVQWGLSKPQQVLTASYEGVNLLVPDAGGKMATYRLGEGNQTTPAGNRGSSEIKFGKLKDGRFILASVEPFHGTQAAVYVQPAGGGGVAGDQVWPRTVLDETLTGGHAVACADLDGDGNDEIVIGWRDVLAGKPPVGIRIFKVAGDGTDPRPAWQMTQLEKGGVACEDLAVADLNGDGKPDVVAVGRATKNVKIYWNETAAKK